VDRIQWEAGGQDRRTSAEDAKHGGDVLGLSTDAYSSSLLCVAVSSKTASVSGPHGSQAHGKSCGRGGGIQGQELARQAEQYIPRWISAWTRTRGEYGLCPRPSSSCRAFFHPKSLVM